MEILTKEQRLAQGPATQQGYEEIIDEIATIRMNKVLSYGEDRYTDEPTDQEHHLFITYSDIYRKYIRIKEFFTKGLSVLKAKDGESLRDAFLDLANYAIMGVQLYDNLPKPQEEIEAKPTMQIDQVAIYSTDPQGTKDLLNMIFGLSTWHKDTVVASGQVFDKDGANKAELNFNYEIMKNGVEFEVLHYESGPNWVEENSQTYGVCHLGVHVENIEEITQQLIDMGYKVAQEVRTQSHTNPVIKDSRRYHYVIFDTRREFGFDLKLIQRLPYTPGDM